MTTRRFVHEGFRSLDSRDLSVDFDSGLYEEKKPLMSLLCVEHYNGRLD